MGSGMVLEWESCLRFGLRNLINRPNLRNLLMMKMNGLSYVELPGVMLVVGVSWGMLVGVA